ncbi:member of major facilitator superfamily multidrug- dha1 sub-family [Moniliophthora roreri MCA 2997]|uniref:Member of major facilitator superfamily multidrug-dha1 sub-family n=1 Tax=Moniliophthora roreri (strain MCA 2997) TaxID=1381753 RepID=V2XST1_MONRO|nr:member of major facilitator superfamily multidrug- dha1 sub-family [Moniliophthora roreri MCA 2997]
MHSVAESENETTSLLHDQENTRRKSRTKSPLPKLQIAIILLLQICEPLTSQSIYPYINQLVSELDITGGDERKVGYYAGLIESLFFVTEAFTVLQWSRLSDRIGRKPVLLIGLAGSGISMLSFGLQRSFWGLVIARCLTGLLNGNIGVMKSTMGDLTDQSNRAEGFSLMPVVWSIGATVGPLLGGTFARPHERFPNAFKSQFWKDYPYFMPCLVTASFVFMSFIVTLVFFKESAPVKNRRDRQRSLSEASEATLDHEENKPLPLRSLLTWPVIISVSNYVALAFLNIAFNALLPLFLHTPIPLGGLNLPPSIIGYVLGAYGCVTGLFQAAFFARIIHWLGERRIFVNGVASFIGLFAIMPIISVFAKAWGGNNWTVWALIGCILVLAVIMDMAYGAIFMFVTASAPSRSALGATNGLSQMAVSIARAVGPAMATSMFAVSVQEGWVDGYAVYIVFVMLSILAVGGLAVKLPKEVWEEADD